MRVYYVLMYFLSLLLFGLVGLALNAVCAVLLLLPRHPARSAAVRDMIRWLFGRWTAWMHLAGLVHVSWHGPEPAAWPRPAVYVANHPSLIDATLLLARLPAAICIFKPALLRNPCLAPAAIMAGYVPGDAGIDLIHRIGAQLNAGQNLLIFPEGTRTSTGHPFNPLKPGFAVLARHARVPVQVLVVRVDRDVLPRGQPWWRAPRLPAHFEVRLDRLIPVSRDTSADELVREVADRFAAGLPRPAPV
jgi:1-acyl-sn-glycerol-3-phosphate acyltransferase